MNSEILFPIVLVVFGLLVLFLGNGLVWIMAPPDTRIAILRLGTPNRMVGPGGVHFFIPLLEKPGGKRQVPVVAFDAEFKGNAVTKDGFTVKVAGIAFYTVPDDPRYEWRYALVEDETLFSGITKAPRDVVRSLIAEKDFLEGQGVNITPTDLKPFANKTSSIGVQMEAIQLTDIEPEDELKDELAARTLAGQEAFRAKALGDTFSKMGGNSDHVIRWVDLAVRSQMAQRRGKRQPIVTFIGEGGQQITRRALEQHVIDELISERKHG